MLSDNIWVWVIYNGSLAALLFVDLVILGRARAVSMREAGLRTAAWTAVAVIVNVLIFVFGTREEGTAFMAAYVVERALSVDNLFVFLVIFTYFAVPAQYQNRALTWGILGALFFRGVFIAAGVAVVNAFEWTIFILGAFLIYTAFKLAMSKEENVDPEKNLALRIARKLIRISPTYDGQRFFTRRNGVLMATPLLLVVIVLESTDIVFAIDSIPTVLAITTDPFIVWSSNTMAILGMRPLFFVLAGAVVHFRFLKQGLSIVLGFVGAKMLTHEWIHIDTEISLLVILVVLGGSMVASRLFPAPPEEHAAPEGPHPATDSTPLRQDQSSD